MNTIILKLASGCNLGCEYCYEYTKGDDSWKNKPKRINNELIDNLIFRIIEYLNSADINNLNIVFHGGEPLLIGLKNFTELLEKLCTKLKDYKISYFIQTNGTLLNKEFLILFEKYKVRIGLSIDGNESQNIHRVFKNGKESFSKVIESYRLIQSYNSNILSGILCVINLESDPIDVLDFLLRLNPPTIDLLLPFETYDTIGFNVEVWNNKLKNWLLSAFNYWFENERFHDTKIRIFEDILQSLITLSPKTDWFGARSISYLVIQTDGSYDILDHLKVIGKNSETFRSINLNLKEHSILCAINEARLIIINNLAMVTPQKCSICRFEKSCGGGYLPHRYSESNKFDNPSIACDSLYSIFDYLNSRILQPQLSQK